MRKRRAAAEKEQKERYAREKIEHDKREAKRKAERERRKAEYERRKNEGKEAYERQQQQQRDHAKFKKQAFVKGEQKFWQHTCDASINRMEYESTLGLFQKFEGKGAKFQDKSFFGEDMIYWKESSMRRDFRKYVKEAKYPRISDIDKSPSLWGKNGVVLNGVQQGGLGDCWFLGALASVAEWEDRIKPIFTNKDYSKEGIFEVNLWHYGQKIGIVIDDTLPSRKQEAILPIAAR
jgi:hypothetical protein